MTTADFLAGLDDDQAAAAAAVSGPVAIHAGAGSGKTRVIVHRTAHAAATGAMRPGQALLVTFTDKAAGELAERVRLLGVPGVAAMTFHKAAWRQLRHFWPRLHDGEELTILSQPWRLVAPLVRRLPGHYRFTPTKDVLDALSWIANGGIPLADLAARAETDNRDLPIPDDLLARVARDYTRAKSRQSLVDFDDLILRMIDLLRDHDDVAAAVRDRYRWFSVDEFQDTNPAQFHLLRLWLGERSDVCVVGDALQTIYSFTGATSRYLQRFEQWYPSAASFTLTRNYRSTPQVLAWSNRLAPDSPPLRATHADGPEPVERSYSDDDAEAAGIAAALQDWQATGIEYPEMAVLVRLNADIPPLEAALTRADVPFVVRGTQFFARREVAAAIAAWQRLEPTAAVPAANELVLRDQFGYDPDEEPVTGEARERHAALTTLLALAADAGQTGEPALPPQHRVLAELRRRAEAERDHAGAGVTLATVHRTKGLEWDAVIVAGLEDGHFPVQQALSVPEQLAEERRLLYVAITRARRRLLLTRAEHRLGNGGKPVRRRRSRLLAEAAPEPPPRAARRAAPAPSGSGGAANTGLALDDSGQALYERLKSWRLDVARSEAVPAYVVFANSTLAQISAARPGDHAALAAISGVGPAKLERYGDQVLAVVAGDATPG